MSEEVGKSVVQHEVQPGSVGGGEAHPAGNGEIRVVTDKMDRALKILAELADHVGTIAPEHKHIFDDAGAAISEFGTLLLHAPQGANGRVTRVVAPMPGVIIRCEKKPGEEVKKGDVVVVLDAMKVENPIRVPVTGKIISIPCGEGQRVAKGSLLAVVNQ